ncbi:10186_t:CDS:2 [Diversispora eburnea]|uniref:10186_t:CDS:1 n=1 Tax=Diversispora eburnea TaxID=1213867 RepID=A0A9N9BLF5_9GLOM|nr:10186_t:CDS:2 [Diversispora eburnea]
MSHLEGKNQFEDKMERLGNRQVFSIQDEVILKKLFAAENTFWKKFERDEISSIDFGLVDEREVIIVTLDLPKGSPLQFSLPIGHLNDPPNACTLGLLVQTRSKPGCIYILTTRHGVGKKGSPICQPGKLDNVDNISKGCATVTKYNSLSTNKDGCLLDYVLCKISNNNRVPANPNKIYGSEITVCSFKTSVSNDSNNIIEVRKVGRSTYFTEGKMIDQWVKIKSSAFKDKDRKRVSVLKVHGTNGPFGAPGDSGSPVFDKDNQVVGILHGGYDNRPDAYPFN